MKLRKDILKMLKEKGYTQTRIKKENILSGSTLDSIRNANANISVDTLMKLQSLLNCSFDDFFEKK